MSFAPPKQENVNREGRSLPAEGRHNVTITQAQGTTSSKGDPMLVLTYVIDSGKDAGHEMKGYFAFKNAQSIAWSRLACVCDAAGFEWSEEASTIEAFAAQFPLDTLRLSVELEHSFSVKAYLDVDDKYNYNSKAAMLDGEHTHEQWVEVTEEEWEEWPTDDKNKRAQVRDSLVEMQQIYQPAEGEADMKFSEGEYSGDGAPAGNLDSGAEDVAVAGDDLPF